MRIKCKRCGAGIELPAETQSGDVVHCGGCGKKIRIKLRATRRRVQVPAEPAPAEPATRRAVWAWRLIACSVLIGAGFVGWRNWLLDLGRVKDGIQRPVDGEGAIAGAPVDEIEGPLDGEDSLAGQVAALFEERCHRCHGEGGSDEGGFNFVVRLDKLTEEDAYVTPGDPAESYLFSRIEDGEMPPPDEGDPLSEEEVALVRAWIDAGAPPAVSDEPPRVLVKNEDLLRVMHEDLQGLDGAVRPQTRYFTLTHLYNAGLSQDELETYRLALAKLLNSLSWERQLVVPERVDAEETLLRIDLRDLDWTADTWDAIVDTDPYAVTVSSDDGAAIREATGTDVPHVRADWFVSRASRAPLYYDMLEIPDTFDALIERPEIGVDVDQNIADDKVVRAAFVESGVSDNNRMIERHSMRFGGLWVSYDFASSVGTQNVLEHPLGPDGDDAFEHDGGEIIFSLPNGLQGYMLVDSNGKRIEKGPLKIVADDKQPDRAVVAGLSCMSCHSNGMIRKQDEVRPTVLANRAAFPNADRILRQYPDADVLDDVLTDDTRRFEAALQELGFDRLTETSEPIYHMAKRFDQAVDRSLAAAEFGVSTEKFLELLDDSPAVAKVLGVLKLPGGKVKRQQFLAAFKSASREFGFGTGRGDTLSAETPASAVADAGTDPNAASLAEDILQGLLEPDARSRADNPAAPVVGQAGTVPAPAFTPPDLLHQWTNRDGQPLVYARFHEVTPTGDVRVRLVPRQWRLTGDDSNYEYPAFSGTFWAFLQKPGTPVLVRVGEVSLPGAPLDYVDLPREAFCEEDQAYLAHLERLIPYAYVHKGRVRYYTLSWDVISVADQHYVSSVVKYVTSLADSVGPPVEGSGLPAEGPPPSAAVPVLEQTGPPDLPVAEPAFEAVGRELPGSDSSPPRRPYGY